MRNHGSWMAGLFVAAALCGAPACGKTPIPTGLLHPKLNPGYHHPDLLGFRSGPMHDAITQALATGTIQTLPSWSHSFTVAGQTYSYTLLGTDPRNGAVTTTIPTVLIPLRLTISDYMVNGAPLVLDATPTMPDIINSPIFTASTFDSGTTQFEDALLHAEFPKAPAGWHLLFSPAVAPTVNVIMPAGTTTVYQAQSGKYVAFINNGAALNAALLAGLKTASPYAYIVFVSYNSLFDDAFGFHAAYKQDHGNAVTVFTYTSWLEGVNDAFTLPSPNADTLAHEISEATHDAFSTSLTLEWGDWFRKNHCFQPYIEVGDAVEDAPAQVQNYHQNVTLNGVTKTYTLQTEALLPWFEREYPSSAIHQAYSFPSETALLGPAPFTCAK